MGRSPIRPPQTLNPSPGTGSSGKGAAHLPGEGCGVGASCRIGDWTPPLCAHAGEPEWRAVEFVNTLTAGGWRGQGR
jgi:hypothetical protein